MERIKLSDKIEFSRIVQGFWRLTDWNMPTKDLVELLNNCLQREVTTFDTAEIYGGGECEAQLGKALKELKRDDYQIVNKTGISVANVNGNSFGYYNTTYDRILNSCKEGIKKLGCGYLDLYLVHREDPLIDHHEVARALKELKKQGLILEAGVSNFDPFKFNALNNLMEQELKTNQIEWNPCCFEHFNSGMVDVLVEKNIHPMIWSPLAGGRLFTDNSKVYQNAMAVLTELSNKYEVAIDTLVYAWILYHPMKCLPISGSSKIDRLDAAIAALDLNLDIIDWYRIYTASGQTQLR